MKLKHFRVIQNNIKINIFFKIKISILNAAFCDFRHKPFHQGNHFMKSFATVRPLEMIPRPSAAFQVTLCPRRVASPRVPARPSRTNRPSVDLMRSPFPQPATTPSPIWYQKFMLIVTYDNSNNTVLLWRVLEKNAAKY